jgi:hypothetical protein
MTKLFASLLVAAAFVAPLGFAQTPPEKPASETRKANAVPEPVIAPFSVGTVFNAILLTPLDAARNKAGDPATAEVSEAVTYERTVIFPKGTKIYGHLVRCSSTQDKGSALFVRFDKATLHGGQNVMMNAGIQALVSRRMSGADSNVVAGSGSHHGFVKEDASSVMVVPASHELSTTQSASSTAAIPPAQGAVTKDGKLTPDSQGALGSKDIKVYTPLSEGSDGTVLLSEGKTVHLDAGTKLLIVIQPPPETDPSLQ